MAQYRKKPVVIEAFLFGHDRSPEWFVKQFNKGKIKMLRDEQNNSQSAIIPTPEGEMIARPDDYIIRGIKGEIYPCKADIFEATYELVEPGQNGGKNDD